MTVLIYVDTSKQVGDKDHLKVFANADPADIGLRKTIRKALHSSMRFWIKSLAVRYRASTYFKRAAPAPRRTVTCNWKPIASRTLKTVVKFGFFGSPANAR